MTARGVASVGAARDDRPTTKLGGVTSTVTGRLQPDQRPTADERRTARIDNTDTTTPLAKAPPAKAPVVKAPLTKAPLDKAPLDEEALATRSSVATTVPPATTASHRGRRLPVLLPLVAAMATALLGLGDFGRPILAADTSSPSPHPTTATTRTPAAPVGPSCGPGAAPAGHNPPTRIEVATHHTYVPAGWLRWCVGMRESSVGPVKAAWIVMQLDRATVVASDLCQLHDCQIILTMSVPTRGPDLAVYRARIDRTGPAQATLTTTAVIVGGRHDFAEAHSASSTVFISPRGYTESV